MAQRVQLRIERRRIERRRRQGDKLAVIEKNARGVFTAGEDPGISP
jgi:hypothetical protein